VSAGESCTIARDGRIHFTAEDAKIAKKTIAADFADERRSGKQTTHSTGSGQATDTKDHKEAISSQYSAFSQNKGAARKQHLAIST
jgi:hypothetical protein